MLILCRFYSFYSFYQVEKWKYLLFMQQKITYDYVWVIAVAVNRVQFRGKILFFVSVPFKSGTIAIRELSNDNSDSSENTTEQKV